MIDKDSDDPFDYPPPLWIKLWMSTCLDFIDIDEEYQESDLAEIGKVFINLLHTCIHYNEPESAKFPLKDKYHRALYKALKRDLDQTVKDYRNTVKKNRENGKKGGRPPRNNSGNDIYQSSNKRPYKKGNTFNDISKTEYDFNKLEKALLEKNAP